MLEIGESRQKMAPWERWPVAWVYSWGFNKGRDSIGWLVLMGFSVSGRGMEDLSWGSGGSSGAM